jgi:dihydrofolate reductase
MLGSATMVRWLLREGLLDELHLFVHPIAVGASMARLFPSDAPRTALSLTSSERFDTGVVYLTYAPA